MWSRRPGQSLRQPVPGALLLRARDPPSSQRAQTEWMPGARQNKALETSYVGEEADRRDHQGSDSQQPLPPMGWLPNRYLIAFNDRFRRFGDPFIRSATEAAAPVQEIRR